MNDLTEGLNNLTIGYLLFLKYISSMGRKGVNSTETRKSIRGQ